MGEPWKVSIVLPTYNGARFLRRSIDSCLEQTYKNIELIIVDDSSTDATPEIARSYQDSRITYIRHRINRRLPASLNTGFKHAKGDYLTWTSDDNEYMPQAIEEMVDYLQESDGVDFVYADYWEYYLPSQEKKIKRLPDTLDLKNKCEVGACFLYTRKVFEYTGYYNKAYELVEDYDYWIRVMKKFHAAHYPKPLYLYRYHAHSLTITKPLMQALFDRVLRYSHGYVSFQEIEKAYFDFFEFNMYKISRKEGAVSLCKNLIRMYRISFVMGSIFLFLLTRLIAVKSILFCLKKILPKRLYVKLVGENGP